MRQTAEGGTVGDMSNAKRTLLVTAAAVATAAALASATAQSARAEDVTPDAPASRAPAEPPLSSAGPFLLTELHDKLNGRWEHAWSSLTPLHQRLVPEPVYVRCERSTPFLSRTLTLGILHVRRALVTVPGLPRPVPGAAVTLRVALSWYGPRDPIVITPTLHLVAVDGRWRWLLSQQRYSLYKRRGCGQLPPV